ncbi:M23 family metallopeptidase [Paenibacillus polymyxa]|uniref:M23 family metallopeptidase n=1 Tax=Paenibacillus polymyxa TaxID=1406 RepID=UPI003DA962B1
MSVIDTSVEIVDKIQKAKKWGTLLSNPLFWWITLILVIVVVVLFIIAFVLMIYFFPFLLFGDKDAFSTAANINAGYGYDTSAPEQLDIDGSTYFWPVPSIARISSTFGYRELGGREFHKGIDIANGASKTGLAPIYAMADGVVSVAGSVNGYGQAIYIDHANGLRTIYGHLDSHMMVHPGDQVKKGQMIGRIGAGQVGRSTGAHLHFQVEENGTPVDPLKYVSSPMAAGAGDGKVPIELSYKPLNISAVMEYLNKRNSALADPSILAMIDRAGKSTNVSPYLLIAITGQEQSFVPKNNNQAHLIIRNPWNVYGCWCKGKGASLTTEQAAVTAAKTIVKLSKDRPAGRDPLEWINNTTDNPRGFYASDPGWHFGVSRIYRSLSALGG